MYAGDGVSGGQGSGIRGSGEWDLANAASADRGAWG